MADIATVKILDEKWDYLLVLDACRYDYFEKNYSDYFANADFSKRISQGTDTNQWLKMNFGCKSDIIYVTANPQISSTRPTGRFRASSRFEKVYDVWHSDWDDEVYTVRPDVMTKRSLDIIRKHPGKRLIVHYIQPHAPFLNYKDHGDFQKFLSSSWLVKKIHNAFILLFSIAGITEPVTRWKILKKLGIKPLNYMYWLCRNLNDEELKKGYEENLKAVLFAVKTLAESLSGTIVVTADHGEMLGEKGLYGHWANAGQPILREIPWLVIDKGPLQSKNTERKAKSSAGKEEVSAEEVEKKLRMLGYM